ncbi:MAG TPA: hypothetical protein VNM47_12775 [Terriglobia bacterium]|nr:hypothetical protein [Terriglobia bacterium]
MTNRSSREINGLSYIFQPAAGPQCQQKSFLTIELQNIIQITSM